MNEDQNFKNLAAAQRFLQQQGFKVKKSKLYDDRKKELIRVQDDESVLLADVLEYSQTLGPSQTPADMRLKAALVELRRLRCLFDLAEMLITEKLGHVCPGGSGCKRGKGDDYE